ncbi:hypothetical protein EDD16DRAFT_1538843 [Pisolithus croceorrhizus]|nr:hypothetical protein F5141DRAFT_1153947 [Pisolithus sp. B1]KAI6127300.1 hypothetical protein F5141DRAFT_1086943 [Pisolithus sp. B1]KAI6131106.1 hypothetical protein EDD16DRAFT_1538843 [Pisolithus croceorrhizus]
MVMKIVMLGTSTRPIKPDIWMVSSSLVYSSFEQCHILGMPISSSKRHLIQGWEGNEDDMSHGLFRRCRSPRTGCSGMRIYICRTIGGPSSPGLNTVRLQKTTDTSRQLDLSCVFQITKNRNSVVPSYQMIMTGSLCEAKAGVIPLPFADSPPIEC